MSRRRRWLQFVVLGVAAFASIATSKKRGWILEANLARDTPGKSRIAFIEASKQPDVRLDNGELATPLAGFYTGIWNGTARYLIPADRTIASVTIGGGCGGGMCSSGGGCDAPADALVKLLSVKPVAMWRREITTPSAIEEVGGDHVEIPVVASHPIRFEVIAEGRDRHVTQQGDRIVIHWSDSPEGTTKTTWSLRVTMDGICPTETPCEPPPGTTLELGTPKHITKRNGSGR